MKVQDRDREARVRWLLELLNDVIRVESPKLHVGKHQRPPDPQRLKPIEWWKQELTPNGLRSAAASIVGHIVVALKGARRRRDHQQRAAGFDLANRLAKQAMKRFEHDDAGSLIVERIVGPRTMPIATSYLLADAIDLLGHLISDPRFLDRLNCCYYGDKLPLCCGHERRRCLIWFHRRAKTKHHDEACEKRTERIRNEQQYNRRQMERTNKRSAETRKFFEGRKTKRRRVMSS